MATVGGRWPTSWAWESCLKRVWWMRLVLNEDLVGRRSGNACLQSQTETKQHLARRPNLPSCLHLSIDNEEDEGGGLQKADGDDED
jgi:hypothetical protein